MLVVASPEDIIIQKLYRYKLGDEVSDRQWLDVLGVMKVKKNQLDQDYLRQAAAQMDVIALLHRAWEDAGLG